jgi:riboflavin synthase
MFTGIVEDTGAIVGVTPEGAGRRLRVRTAIPLGEVKVGDSIAVDGACLTVERAAGDVFEVVAGKETLDRTTVGTFVVGTPVHLERALSVGARLDGHLVQGHVDGVGTVVDVVPQAESVVLWVDVGAPLARFVAEKGSIALDGVSLTVNEVAGSRCRINLIPHTARVTKLGRKHAGEPLNVEVDVLARYVDRMLGFARGEGTGLTRELLERNGFR